MFDNTLRPLKDKPTSPLADAVGRRLAPDTVSLLACVAGLGETTSVSMPGGMVEGGETVFFSTLLILIPSCRLTLIFLFAGLTMGGAMLRFVQGMALLRKNAG